MESQEFCYWLQGFFEVSEETPTLSKRQIKIIKNHLALVFDKVTEEPVPTLKNILNPPLHSSDSRSRKLC
jgi:hypothetical protein